MSDQSTLPPDVRAKIDISPPDKLIGICSAFAKCSAVFMIFDWGVDKLTIIFRSPDATSTFVVTIEAKHCDYYCVRTPHRSVILDKTIGNIFSGAFIKMGSKLILEEIVDSDGQIQLFPYASRSVQKTSMQFPFKLATIDELAKHDIIVDEEFDYDFMITLPVSELKSIQTAATKFGSGKTSKMNISRTDDDHVQISISNSIDDSRKLVMQYNDGFGCCIINKDFVKKCERTIKQEICNTIASHITSIAQISSLTIKVSEKHGLCFHGVVKLGKKEIESKNYLITLHVKQ